LPYLDHDTTVAA